MTDYVFFLFSVLLWLQCLSGKTEKKMSTEMLFTHLVRKLRIYDNIKS